MNSCTFRLSYLIDMQCFSYDLKIYQYLGKCMAVNGLNSAFLKRFKSSNKNAGRECKSQENVIFYHVEVISI